MVESDKGSWPVPPPRPRFGMPAVQKAYACAMAVTGAAALLYPVSCILRERGSPRSCVSDLKYISMGLTMYAQDNDGRLPRLLWMDATRDYIKQDQVYRCVEAEKVQPRAYGRAFDVRLLGIRQSDVDTPATTASVFDSTLLFRNAVARADSGLPVPGRHHAGNNLAYLDGHVTWLSDDKAKTRWPQLRSRSEE